MVHAVCNELSQIFDRLHRVLRKTEVDVLFDIIRVNLH
jgi:hypothetical protein